MVLTIIKRFLVTEDFFECNLKFLFLTGLWPDENFTGLQVLGFRQTHFIRPRLPLKLYKTYEHTLNTFMIIFFILSGISTARCTDTIKFLSNIDKSVVSYNFFFKVICFTIKREKMKLLIDDIITSGDKVTDRTKDNMIKLLVTVTFLCASVIMIFSLIGLINNEMTIEAWMPFDPYKSKINLLASAQVLLVLYAVPFVLRAMAMESMVCSLLLYLCDQLEDLQKRIRALKYTKANEKPLRDELKKIVRKHIRLVRYANSMEVMFKDYFLIQNISVTLELCINAVLVTTVTKDQISVIFAFAFYLGIALVNAFIYCSLGNDLILQSLDVAQAAYDSEWTSWPVELQKTVLLIITVAQRPLKMSAGGFVLVDIQNYANALYNGYSIFAVLNDVVN